MPTKDVKVLTNGRPVQGVFVHWWEYLISGVLCTSTQYSNCTAAAGIAQPHYCHWATGWTVRVFNPVIKARSMFFFCNENLQTGAPPTAGSFPVLQRPEHEADRPPPSSAEFENEWSLAYTHFARPHLMYWVRFLSDSYLHIWCYSGPFYWQCAADDAGVLKVSVCH